jgi:phosphopantothenoylcysteine decarboxylase
MVNPPFDSSLYINDNKHHLLLCCTGSVATIKLPVILNLLSTNHNLSIRVVLTAAAAQFLAGQSLEQPSLASISTYPNVDGIYLDADEWDTPWVRGAKILHIELRRWADLMVVAPCSADALAKIVGGMADSLVLSVIRAWDTTGLIDTPRIVSTGVAAGDAAAGPDGVENESVPMQTKKKLILIAPAMNTGMWQHPVTNKHIDVLEGEWNVKNGGWFEVLRPVEKELACGDTGSGAMKEWRDIVSRIEGVLDLGRRQLGT